MKKIDRIIKESISDYVKDLLGSSKFSECDDILKDIDNDPRSKRRNTFMYKTYIKPFDNIAKNRRDCGYVQGQDDDIE